MNEIERQTLESLNYLLWVHNPRSDKSEEIRDKIMVKNHLLLNPISLDEEDCCGMDAITTNKEKVKNGK